MNALEKILLALVATASVEAPIFVHSPQGILIMNASETLLANLLTQLSAAKAPAPTPAS